MLTDQSASTPHCFAQWREKESYALRDWKEAAGCLNHSLLHSSQLRQAWGPHCCPSPGAAQAGAADLKSRQSLWLGLLTHSTVNAKESSMASVGDGNWVCVGLRSHSSDVVVLQLRRELYSWKSPVVQTSRQERQIPCICP